MCGLMFKDRSADPTRVYTIDGNTELTLETIGQREVRKFKSAVSSAVYERCSDKRLDKHSRLSALITADTADIRFMEGLLKIVATPKQRTKKPTLNLPVRTSSRARNQTQKYKPPL